TAGSHPSAARGAPNVVRPMHAMVATPRQVWNCPRVLNAYISGTGFHVPERRVTNDQLRTEYGIDTSHEWILQRTGIEERRSADEGVGTSDLAVHASRAALAKARLRPHDLDMIVFATLSPDHCFPGSGVYLQQKLGLCDGPDAKFVPALDVRNQ